MVYSPESVVALEDAVRITKRCVEIESAEGDSCCWEGPVHGIGLVVANDAVHERTHGEGDSVGGLCGYLQGGAAEIAGRHLKVEGISGVAGSRIESVEHSKGSSCAGSIDSWQSEAIDNWIDCIIDITACILDVVASC